MSARRILVGLLPLAAGAAAVTLRRRRGAGRGLAGQEITELLTARHQQVRALIAQYQSADDPRARLAIFRELRRLLSVHEAVEEQIVHPVVRRAVPGRPEMVARLLDQEREAKELLHTLEQGAAQGELDDARVATLFEGVSAHAATEENEVFPQLRLQVDAGQRARMGGAVERAERMAPTHPHPKAPSSPPGNVLVGVPAAALDRARDALGKDG